MMTERIVYNGTVINVAFVKEKASEEKEESVQDQSLHWLYAYKIILSTTGELRSVFLSYTLHFSPEALAFVGQRRHRTSHAKGQQQQQLRTTTERQIHTSTLILYDVREQLRLRALSTDATRKLDVLP